MNNKILTEYKNFDGSTFLVHFPSVATYPDSLGVPGDSPPDIQGHLAGYGGACPAPGWALAGGWF